MEPAKSTLTKLLLLAVLVGVAGALYWWLHDSLSLEYIASREAELRAWRVDYPLTVAASAIGIYAVVAGLSLPGATVLTLACGWYFGFWRGLWVVSFGSTGGAMVAFLLSRYLLREWFQSRVNERFSRINAAFEREGALYLFSLRLLPAVPFFVINTVMGLTHIRARTFWWVSQLGMLPGTAAYVYAGSAVPSLRKLADEGLAQVVSWQMLGALAILGILPLVFKRVLTLIQTEQKLRQL